MLRLTFLVFLLSSCAFYRPVPVNPDSLLSDEECKDVPRVWAGDKGQSPADTNEVWKCGNWIIYDKEVDPL